MMCRFAGSVKASPEWGSVTETTFGAPVFLYQGDQLAHHLGDSGAVYLVDDQDMGRGRTVAGRARRLPVRRGPPLSRSGRIRCEPRHRAIGSGLLHAGDRPLPRPAHSAPAGSASPEPAPCGPSSSRARSSPERRLGLARRARVRRPARLLRSSGCESRLEKNLCSEVFLGSSAAGVRMRTRQILFRRQSPQPGGAVAGVAMWVTSCAKVGATRRTSGKDDLAIVFSGQRLVGGVAGEPGFEPGPTESESAVLPLNYSPTATGAELPSAAGRVKGRRRDSAAQSGEGGRGERHSGNLRACGGFSRQGGRTISTVRRVLSFSSWAQILVAYSFSRELALLRVVACGTRRPPGYPGSRGLDARTAATGPPP